MNLTPSWQQIQENHTIIHPSLQWVAAAIYEQSKGTVPIPPTDEIDLTQGIELGFLKVDDSRVGFTDPSVRHDYLVHHAVDLVLVAWDELENFASLFDQIYRCSILVDFNTQIGVTVLLVLNFEYNKDLVSRVAELGKLKASKEKENNLREKFYDFFCDALPQLNVEIESLVDVFELIFQTNAGYKVYSAAENLAARSQTNADFIYNKFIAHQEPSMLFLVYCALQGLASLNIQEAHKRSLVLADSEQLPLRQIAIRLLGELNYEINEHSELLQITLDKFSIFKTTFNSETDLILLEAYGNLTNKSDEAAATLVEFASSQIPSVRQLLSNILFQKGKEVCSYLWYKQALLHLVEIPSFSAEMLNYLDYCINYCLKSDPSIAIQLIELIALRWDYVSRQQASLPKILDTTFIELHNNHISILNTIITRWLASQNKQLHLAGSDIIHFFILTPLGESDGDTTEVVHRKTVKNRLSIRLSKEVLDTLDEQTITYVLYRLAGYITDIPSLAPLLLSVLERESYSPDIAKLIVKLLAQYVLYNHPREAGDYLKNRIKDDDVTQAEIRIIQEALDDSNAYFDARQKLPYLKELKPPSHRIYLLQLALSKQNALTMEKAEQSSVLASIFPKVKIKYGRAVAYQLEGEFTEPSQMASFSWEAEFPQGELINPLGQLRMRLKFQGMGLNKTNNSAEDEIVGEVTV